MILILPGVFRLEFLYFRLLSVPIVGRDRRGLWWGLEKPGRGEEKQRDFSKKLGENQKKPRAF